MSATQKQIEANRRNALRSTGPKTPEGKARSRANAVKHGHRSIVVMPHEDSEEIERERAAYTRCFGPKTSVSRDLADKTFRASRSLDFLTSAEDAERATRAENVMEQMVLRKHREIAEAMEALPQAPFESRIVLLRSKMGCECFASLIRMLIERMREDDWDTEATDYFFGAMGSGIRILDGPIHAFCDEINELMEKLTTLDPRKAVEELKRWEQIKTTVIEELEDSLKGVVETSLEFGPEDEARELDLARARAYWDPSREGQLLRRYQGMATSAFWKAYRETRESCRQDFNRPDLADDAPSQAWNGLDRTRARRSVDRRERSRSVRRVRDATDRHHWR